MSGIKHGLEEMRKKVLTIMCNNALPFDTMRMWLHTDDACDPWVVRMVCVLSNRMPIFL